MRDYLSVVEVFESTLKFCFVNVIIFLKCIGFSSNRTMSSVNLRLRFTPCMLRSKSFQFILRKILANTAENSLGDMECACPTLLILNFAPKVSSCILASLFEYMFLIFF